MRTKTSRFGWMFGVLGAWSSYAAIVIAPGCGATDTQNGGTDSNTHWLEPCDRDSECDEGLSCVCGVCTEPCDEENACSGLDGASCALANTCAGPRDETSCVVECQRDRDCAELGASFVCDAGQCLHRSIAPEPGSGGQGGEDGGQAGALGGSGGKGGQIGNGGVAGGPVAGAPPRGGAGPGGFAGFGGIFSVDGGSPATGGSAGRGGSAIAGAGSPSTGGSGPTGPCAPMDVEFSTGVDLPCLPGAPTYYWNGNFCTESHACQCTGEDCDELYPSMAACDQSYRACYADLGITGACETDADCKLTYRGCCPSCGEQRFETLAATNEAETELWRYCPSNAGCPDCVQGAPTPEAAARCEAGRCTVASICTSLDASGCEAAPLCELVYARFPGELDQVYVGCRYSGEDAACGDGATACGANGDSMGDTACMVFGTACMPRNYVPLDCSATACQP